MKKLFLIIPFLLLLFCGDSFAQTAEVKTEEKVCISREAAEKCSKAFDVVKAQEAEIAELKKIVNELKVELAAKTGQLIANDEERARLTVIVSELLKNPRRQIKVGIFNF